jgi:hypothetical protein
MLWMLLVILILMWALGLGFGIAGNLIHILLAVALVVLVVNLLQGRRAAECGAKRTGWKRHSCNCSSQAIVAANNVKYRTP